jgi:septal ring factor EnvC (AmiA/AmiB activator)
MKTARAAVTGLALLWALPLGAESVVSEAQRAADDFAAAIAALQSAESARDQVAALSQTIRAYELGLGQLREGLRAARQREAQLAEALAGKRARIAALLGVLIARESDPAPVVLLHPAGPLASVRAGLLLSDVTPAVESEAKAVAADLEELLHLRALQGVAEGQLTQGLQQAQAARVALSQAISDRRALPRRLDQSPEALEVLLQNADTLAAFADGLAPGPGVPGQGFVAAKGRLALPVLGQVLRRPNEADVAGVRRPGLTLATLPHALVTAPAPATLRYLGPLLDYGNVIVLEPAPGYLLILSGLDVLYGTLGEVVPEGAPLGLMGGVEGAGSASETLYMELRAEGQAIDPEPWFAKAAP